MFKKKVDKKTIGRLLGYVFKEYKVQFVIVMILVVLSSLTSIASSLFMETLIDDYISPMLLQENPVFTPLLKALAIMACIYIIGILSSYFYNIIMSKTSQGTLKTIRDEMFEKMEKLPIRYFDTHTHGDIMSYYTNDTDTLRELISRGIPEIVSMVITIISTFIAMLCTSAYLTLLVIVVAITGISSFAIPDYSFGLHVRITRFVFIFLGYLCGFLGIALGLFVYLSMMAGTTSFGVPYMTGVSPLEKEKGNTYFLPPIWKREYRSTFLRSKKEKKQADISMKWRD